VFDGSLGRPAGRRAPWPRPARRGAATPACVSRNRRPRRIPFLRSGL